MRRLLADPELDRLESPTATLPDAPAIPAYQLETMRRLIAGEPVAVHRPSLGWRIRQTIHLIRNGSYFVKPLAWAARRLGLMVGYGELHLRTYHRDGSITEYGLASRKLVTDAGVAYLCNDMNNAASSADISLFKFHGFGTGTTAESAAQTALVTELTTEYAVNSTRPTGSQASSTNTYTSVGTLTPDSGGTLAITEHGLFSASSSTTLWDRSKFTAVNLDSTAGDSLAATYVATFPSGG